MQVSVVQIRPWAPSVPPPPFFAVRTRPPGSITLAKPAISAYISARRGPRPSAPIRPLRVHRGYIGRAGYIGSGALVVRFREWDHVTGDSKAAKPSRKLRTES